jgi:hypothetical protein
MAGVVGVRDLGSIAWRSLDRIGSDTAQARFRCGFFDPLTNRD